MSCSHCGYTAILYFQKHPSPPTTTWDTSLHQKAAPCCHRGSARHGTPVLSENPNTSVSALEAQMEYFQPRVTSKHTKFTQQEPGMLSSHLETSLQGSRSKQLLVRCFSRKQWLLVFWLDDRFISAWQEGVNSENLQVHENDRKLNSSMI